MTTEQYERLVNNGTFDMSACNTTAMLALRWSHLGLWSFATPALTSRV